MHIWSSPGRSRALVASIAVLVCAAFALTATGTATASACGDKILADWWDNGRIDRVYPLNCYREAIDSIPNDIRDYANVEDVISRALQEAARGDGPGGPSDPETDPRGPADPDPGGDDAETVSDVNTDAPSSIPIPLLVLGAMSVALVGAGGLGYLARRRGALGDGGEAADAPPDDAVDV